MISSTILNEVIDMNVRASEIKDLSRVMDLINQAKEYFKDNNINQWQKGYPDISTILDDIISGNSYVLSKHSHTYGTMHFFIGIEPNYVRIYNGHWLTNTRHYGIIHRFVIDNNHKGNGYAKNYWIMQSTSVNRVVLLLFV